MKYFSNIHIVFLSFLISSIALAQPSIKESSGIEYISSRTVNLLNDSNDYTGSPYFNKEFLKGNVLYKGKIIASNQDIRYNVSHELFEIKSPKNKSSKVVNTIVRDTDIEIEIGSDSFEYISSSKNGIRGYFIPLFKGKNKSLYKKITKKYIQSRKATNSMSKDVAAMYKEKIVLYLINESGEMLELSSSKKNKLKAFGGLRAEVKTYTKQQGLNLNKEADLIKVVSHFDEN